MSSKRVSKVVPADAPVQSEERSLWPSPADTPSSTDAAEFNADHERLEVGADFHDSTDLYEAKH